MVLSRLTRCLGAAILIAACQEEPEERAKNAKPPAVSNRAATLAIEGPRSVAVGEKVIVKFSRPLDPANDRHWITVIDPGQPDSQWGAWGYVNSAAREAELPAVSAPGHYEVRLHANYPAQPYHVVARTGLVIVASDTPSLTTAADATSAATPSTPTIAAGDIDAMARTDFGSPTTAVQRTLHVQRWASDGGGQEAIRPSDGHRFLVVMFPNADAPGGQIFYDSRQVSLRVGGIDIPALGPTTGGASAPSTSVAPDGTRVFQPGAWASTYPPTSELPFGLAFEVPFISRGGTLKLGARTIELSW